MTKREEIKKVVTAIISGCFKHPELNRPLIKSVTDDLLTYLHAKGVSL